MKRNTRAEKAQETLKIIEQGFYELDNHKIKLHKYITHSVEQSKLYKSEGFDIVFEDVNNKLKDLNFVTEIEVRNTTVLKAAQHIVSIGETVGCLNFASAKNPGGGFLGGAQAQEESLALSSALYPTLTEHFEMYEYNRNRSTFLYSDYMIYSPDVVMFRNDDGDLLKNPYTISLITSPAVNIGAMENNNRTEELGHAEVVMMERMDKILGLFVFYNIHHLLLGAWGCGVFQNDAKNIADYFASYLLNNGKYSHAFKSVTFAVLDRSKNGENIQAFEKVFNSVEQ